MLNVPHKDDGLERKHIEDNATHLLCVDVEDRDGECVQHHCIECYRIKMMCSTCDLRQFLQEQQKVFLVELHQAG